MAAFATLEDVARLLRAGNLGKAERCCKQILKRQPHNAQALHLMALAIHHGGRPAAAVAPFRKALKYERGDAIIHYNLGECYRALGKADAAVASYRQALAIQPGDANAQAGIGEARLAQGRTEDAEAGFRAATEARPDLVTTWNGLGMALRGQGRLAEAVDCWRRALAIDPGLAVVYNNLGLGLRSLGDFDEAMAVFLRALELQPDNATIRQNFVGCLKNRPVTTVTPGLKRLIETCLDASDVDAQTLLPAALSVLEADAGFAVALDATGSEGSAGLDETGRAALWRNALFLRLLETTFLARPRWERLLTRLRADILANPETTPTAAIVAVALQCFNNEYVLAIANAEQDAFEALRRDLEVRLAASAEPSPALERQLACIGMYLPLHTLGGDRLLGPPADAWSSPIRRLLERQVREPLEERRIRATIPSISASDDRVSAAVKEMYEENPYPRWMSTSGRQPQTAHAVLRGLFPHFQPPGFTRGFLDILIAGCGTGKQAIDVATRYEGCRVLAVDLSLSSLSYAQRMARKLDVDNIEVRQADILGLAVLDDRFHLIECSGVLMAIEDPLAAWELLTQMLRPDGLMKIGLYSEIARRHVVAARSFIAERGYPSTIEGIRQCRLDIASLPAGRIECKVLENRDFYSTSSCRDLIFHVQEHRFTLPQIADMLARLGLRFIGFELNKPEVLNAYRAAFPDDADMTDLANWHRFEQGKPDTFIAMYQFWCQKI